MEAESETTATVAANDTKPSIGKTGVHKKLTCEQCHELGEW